MLARHPKRLVVIAAVLAMLITGCEAKVYGASHSRSPEQRTDRVAPLVQMIMPPDSPPDSPPVEQVFEQAAEQTGLPARIQQATEQAAADGATISVSIFDRATRQTFSNGNDQLIGIASVAKLFIADDLLLRDAQGLIQLSADDRQAIETMLRSSDDNAAEIFWSEYGADAIITEVAGRYGLTSTTPPSSGRWWDTMSSASDLIRYYDMLLSGSGGLSRERGNIIVQNLAQFTATGVDGYPQRFGIPDGLDAEPVAVKQGWMCCIGSDWMHLSTGIIGSDQRYIMVIESLQPSDDATARTTITQAVKTMFPQGRI
ncbi:hypothetical protein [Mycobacterium shimoidei]|uniref:Lipoprotein LppW n=1 Tax=Mycobacterium shimoidei TaxID=29313 RepID=A0A1E3T4C1_MYCSH|nr:hypothetical protein [Mycobacterium shimoidei]MCV7261398.1 hypothetical protein [Mycobacterium shimoidei]ODR09250.1 hypothetical protein BHQ16_19935 [Mycobacterium shimoidei]ORW77468.1 hypothetical protein AWC26_19630 [Mycobacterium shimoidei]SRX95911.1 hypothetical protein MSP7336_04184 [Mycobacterium shimoidei]